jgi:hypothetical protein
MKPTNNLAQLERKAELRFRRKLKQQNDDRIAELEDIELLFGGRG